jgi:hypothetical protein
VLLLDFLLKTIELNITDTVLNTCIASVQDILCTVGDLEDEVEQQMISVIIEEQLFSLVILIICFGNFKIRLVL